MNCVGMVNGGVVVVNSVMGWSILFAPPSIKSLSDADLGTVACQQIQITSTSNVFTCKPAARYIAKIAI